MAAPERLTAAERRAMPNMIELAQATAEKFGVCSRPVGMRAFNPETGQVSYLGTPCKCTVESTCPSCAKAAQQLRATQCNDGWHLEREPMPAKTEPTEHQKELLTARADMAEQYWEATRAGDPETAQGFADVVADLDAELKDTGLRGRLPALDAEKKGRPGKSTRRRDDSPDLPRRKVEKRTVGQVYAGKYRPGMFVTLTLPSYGRVREGGAVDPDGYNYRQAARDIVHFAALFDRWVQNLRRVVGWNVQYFATVEPQKRGAPHLHIAIRGSVSREVLRQVTAATYKQIWWPHHDTEVYGTDDRPYLPEWDYELRAFIDPGTGEPVTTWAQAQAVMDSVDELEPAHVTRFGSQVDIKGVLGGTRDAARRVGYLTKYLTKSVAEVLDTDDVPASTAAHYDRLHAELCRTPCSPRCPVWFRYGIVPKGATEKTRPGVCRSKAHKRDFLGLPGRRVLVSRWWTGKTLPDHKAERFAFVQQLLADAGIERPQLEQLRITPVRPGDSSAPPREHLIMSAVAQRSRWRVQYLNALGVGLPDPPGQNCSATHETAA
ncbi:replication initiator [Nocardia takedensis]|uniref:replication initiator n=1 Tax=Nocardia takedensis TaxID=259390 RepID=UPI00068641E3|nr:replication initiator [Nocardia takedensis]